MKYTSFFLLISFCFGIKADESPCNMETYEDYIFDSEKTKDLIQKTGKGCHLRLANLRGVNFKGASLRLADLRGANLREGNFRETDLRGANLTRVYGAFLGRIDFTGARYNSETKFPWFFSPKRRGMVEVRPMAFMPRDPGKEFNETEREGNDSESIHIVNYFTEDETYSEFVENRFEKLETYEAFLDAFKSLLMDVETPILENFLDDLIDHFEENEEFVKALTVFDRDHLKSLND